MPPRRKGGDPLAFSAGFAVRCLVFNFVPLAYIAMVTARVHANAAAGIHSDDVASSVMPRLALLAVISCAYNALDICVARGPGWFVGLQVLLQVLVLLLCLGPEAASVQAPSPAAGAAAVVAAQVPPAVSPQLRGPAVPPPTSGAEGLAEPSTISVVLPCLNESENTVQTVRSFCERTPTEYLYEIIVVDDGSSPPLEIILRENIPDRCKLKVLRHSKPFGLMIAKQTGGDAAKGKFIGFYDCHVAPSKTWYIETIKLLEMNDRRMVVPMIGDLNMTSWDEKVNGALTAKCYINLGTADFWWYDDDSDWIPIISGGLVATTRKWWRLSGGFDGDMRGWGGENSDQSLTAWLCGADIVRAKTSTVSHMWRVAGDRRTRAKFHTHFPGVDNMARVAAGWFDEWKPKFRGGSLNPNMNVSTILDRRKKLGCKPFAYFLHRFRKIYLDSGMLPSLVFKIRLKDTGHGLGSNLCLKRHGRTYGLSDCGSASFFHEANWVPKGFPLAADLDAGLSSGESDGAKPDQVTCGGHFAPTCAQCPQGHGEGWCHVDCTWVFGECVKKDDYHKRMEKRETPKCCSGIREWNALECFDTMDQNGPTAYACDVTGKNKNQQYIFDSKGRIRHQSGMCLHAASSSKASAAACDGASQWEKVESFVPEETTLYHEAVKRLGYSEDAPDH